MAFFVPDIGFWNLHTLVKIGLTLVVNFSIVIEFPFQFWFNIYDSKKDRLSFVFKESDKLLVYLSCQEYIFIQCYTWYMLFCPEHSS